MRMAAHGPEHPATAIPCHVRDGRDDAPLLAGDEGILREYFTFCK
jgi:hypothetical protein